MEDQEQVKQNSPATSTMPVVDEVPGRTDRPPYRVYYAVLVPVYFVALILALIALGSFGVKEAQVRSYQRRYSIPNENCILYGKPLTVNNKDYIQLSTSGPCNFVLWGQVSVLIVVFVWFIYSIVLVALGLKIVSAWRLIDVAMAVGTGALSFALSVTIHAGLDATCRAFNGCGDLAYIQVDGIDEKLYFYDAIRTTRVTSWITMVVFLILSIWYSILALAYCTKACKRKRNAQPQYNNIVGDYQDDSDTNKFV